MRRRILLAFLLTIGAFYERSARAQIPPTVRIGLTQNAATVSLRSADDFTIQQNRTRTAKFSMVLKRSRRRATTSRYLIESREAEQKLTEAREKKKAIPTKPAKPTKNST